MRFTRAAPAQSLIIVAHRSITQRNPLPFNDLRQWIAALDRAGQLKRIYTEADPILEIAEITDRVSKSRDAKGARGGAALLFQSVKGHPGSQVLINQFGSEALMNL